MGAILNITFGPLDLLVIPEHAIHTNMILMRKAIFGASLH